MFGDMVFDMTGLQRPTVFAVEHISDYAGIKMLRIPSDDPQEMIERSRNIEVNRPLCSQRRARIMIDVSRGCWRCTRGLCGKIEPTVIISDFPCGGRRALDAAVSSGVHAVSSQRMIRPTARAKIKNAAASTT